MSKMGRMLIVIIAIMIQIALGILYGFSGISVPAWGCFLIWCICAAIIYKAICITEIV